MTVPDSHVAAKRVWVIGAGASHGHSGGLFPTLAGLPRAAQATGATIDWGHSSGIVALDAFCTEHFGQPFASNVELNWEELLSALDISLGLGTHPSIAEARSALLSVIRRTFRMLHDNWGENVHQQGKELEYDQLASSFRPNDTVITFNWDVLLDNAMGREWLLGGKFGASQPYRNFHLQLLGAKAMVFDGSAVSQPLTAWGAQHSYYLKLHGSIDWFGCENDRCANLPIIFPVLDLSDNKLCGSCMEPMRALIVPPTLDKRPHSSSWSRRLWRCAAWEIAHATELVLWGYSLPPTDFHSNWLMRQTRPHRLKRLAIIDPAVVDYRKADDPWTELGWQFVERLRRILPSHSSDLSIDLYELGDDFFKGRDVAAKYPELRQEVEGFKSAARRA